MRQEKIDELRADTNLNINITERQESNDKILKIQLSGSAEDSIEVNFTVDDFRSVPFNNSLKLHFGIFASSITSSWCEQSLLSFVTRSEYEFHIMTHLKASFSVLKSGLPSNSFDSCRSGMLRS